MSTIEEGGADGVTENFLDLSIDADQSTETYYSISKTVNENSIMKQSF